MKIIFKIFFCFYIITLMIACSSKKDEKLFDYVDVSQSNIHFTNTISINEEINVIDFQYCYNGGGVGIGDFNNDQLPDLVFTGNQVSSKIYLNQGDLSFLDITEKSHFQTKAWVTGVSIVDINEDGLDDIYLNVGGANCNNNCNNLLFINQGVNKNGIPEFVERAKEYALDDAQYSQQSVFFDYDQDGDLDVYIAHNGNTTYDKNTPTPKRYVPDHLSDYILRNDSVAGVDHPVFTNVSSSLGITGKGFSLGVGINDFNGDDLPDVYVSNDFITEDLLYLNRARNDSLPQRFEEHSQQYLAHETYNAMGVDIADINNDALPDILVLDMLPNEYNRQKKMLGVMNYDKYQLSKENGYATQYMRNTLQLNNGAINDKPLKTSEVGFMSGISSTDWSWAPLMVDFDNDGDKDIFITNGYVKNITDLDFINYTNQNNVYGTPEAREAKLKKLVKELPGVKLTNFFYENNGTINFSDVSAIWADEKKSFSNGAAFADLDLDGDLDVVVNNINQKAFLLENKTSENPKKKFIRIKLKGTKQNPKAIGAKVTLFQNGTSQYQFQSVIRGYLSSVEPIVHFGVQDTVIDSLKVKWPNGKTTTKYHLAANKILNLNQSEASETPRALNTKKSLFLLDTTLLRHNQDDLPFNEYRHQHLMVKQYTQQSSCIIAADIDGIVGDEIFIGGSNGKPSSIWFQNADGTYTPKQFLDADYDDSQAVFIDIDFDEDLDLYVASGGNRFDKKSTNYEDRVYLNDGKGVFIKSDNIIPKTFQSTSSIAFADFDKDGDFDAFVGARLTPKEYPLIPQSSFLVNDNRIFNAEFHALFANLGMVTSAVWADVDNDSWLDLIVVGEFMKITVFKNSKGNLEPMSTTWFDNNGNKLDSAGWWNSIEAADFDKDGDIDFIIGNQGTNSFMNPTQDKPIHVYKKDFDLNGSLDPILAKYFNTSKGELLLPIHSRDDIIKQLTSLKNEHTTYESFAKTGFKELLNIKNLASESLHATIFESSYAENLGNGKFKLHPLPEECQLAPINAILIDDFNADNHLDFLVVGNDNTAETHYGNKDALTGLFVKGNGGAFEVVPSKESGFYVPKQSNHIVKVTERNGQEFYIATQYNNETKVFFRN